MFFQHSTNLQNSQQYMGEVFFRMGLGTWTGSGLGFRILKILEVSEVQE